VQLANDPRRCDGFVTAFAGRSFPPVPAAEVLILQRRHPADAATEGADGNGRPRAAGPAVPGGDQARSGWPAPL
jgi:hypothetical protein